MMKINLFVLAALALACATAQDAPAPPAAQKSTEKIIKQDSEINANSYNFDFEISDGTARQEQGDYANETGLVVKGSYNYTAPDGQHIVVTYVADKGGFQPKEQLGAEQPAQPQA